MAASQPAQSPEEQSPEGPYEPEAPAEPPAPDGPPSPLAEPGQRLLARIVDTLIVGLPVIMVVRELVAGRDVDVVAPPAVAGCLLLYEAIQLAVWGRTLGKRFAGIEVVAAESRGPSARPGVLRAVLRAAVYALPVAVRPVPVLGLLAGFFWVANAGFLYEGTSRQALHDRLAGTVVLKRPGREPAPL
ncbi:RDD family protein [Actinomadura rubrisoli]|uniref:RDD family protein n=1 Tax=Actinomadura rubrisoli TaxID=2530368 RepID=A0A4R4ZQM6_9ACTN|nr:RDD family protein [Actinomadura rubrisoli]TDD61243.1 RDD family protein [Actinomadura rubrisoli]